MIIDIPVSTLPANYDDGDVRAEVLRTAEALHLGWQFDHSREVNTRDHGKVLRMEGVRLLPRQSDWYRAHSGVFSVEELAELKAKGKMPRRKNAICFHGHREWMRGVLAIYPQAIIRTVRAVYSGRDDFEATYLATTPDLRHETCACVDTDMRDDGCPEPYDAAHLTALGMTPSAV